MIENNSELLKMANIKRFVWAYDVKNLKNLIKVFDRTKKFDFTS